MGANRRREATRLIHRPLVRGDIVVFGYVGLRGGILTLPRRLLMLGQTGMTLLLQTAIFVLAALLGWHRQTRIDQARFARPVMWALGGTVPIFRPV